MSDKEYPVPEETQLLFLDYQSAVDCRDKAINSVFRAKRAIYYGREARIALAEFWNQIYDLYPDLKNKSIAFDHALKTIVLKTDPTTEKV